MSFLRCGCGEMLRGIQVSRHVLEKGEYRFIEYKVGGLMDLGVWDYGFSSQSLESSRHPPRYSFTKA